MSACLKTKKVKLYEQIDPILLWISITISLKFSDSKLFIVNYYENNSLPFFNCSAILIQNEFKVYCVLANTVGKFFVTVGLCSPKKQRHVIFRSLLLFSQ